VPVITAVEDRVAVARALREVAGFPQRDVEPERELTHDVVQGDRRIAREFGAQPL
jgi:hypothetical protein